jgi:hypothetical protein
MKEKRIKLAYCICTVSANNKDGKKVNGKKRKKERGEEKFLIRPRYQLKFCYTGTCLNKYCITSLQPIGLSQSAYCVWMVPAGTYHPRSFRDT